jgi:Putative antitoxin of bacterial toxin-antitoxin system, YdaS/YdaT
MQRHKGPPAHAVVKIVRQLGGSSAVAAHLGISMSAIHKWRTNGIPGNRCRSLLELADQRGTALSLEELLTARPIPETDENVGKSVFQV